MTLTKTVYLGEASIEKRMEQNESSRISFEAGERTISTESTAGLAKRRPHTGLSRHSESEDIITMSYTTLESLSSIELTKVEGSRTVLAAYWIGRESS